MKKALSLLLAIVFVLPALSAKPVSAADGDIIISFGDSITASGVWQKQLDERFGTHIINLGVGGDNSEAGLARLNTALSKNPDIVILMFGANDSAKDMEKGRTIDQFLANMEIMIDAFQSRGAKVICILQSYYCAEDYYTRHDRSAFDDVGGIEAYMDSYIFAYRDLALRKGCYIADVRSLCDAYPNRRSIIADGIHPNNEGYKLYAKAVGDALIGIYSGDVNGDGRKNADDYLLLKRTVMGTAGIDKYHIMFADMNGDGRISAADYIMLKRKILM